MRRDAFLLCALTFIPASASAADPATRPKSGEVEAFDGKLRRRNDADSPRPGGFAAADGSSFDFCAPAVLTNPKMPRDAFSVDARIACRPAVGTDRVAAFLALASPGEPGGAFGGRGIRALLGEEALGDADLRRRLRGYYAVVRSEDRGPAPAAGWAWTRALAAAEGDPRLAMRLVGFCGHDDLQPGVLRENRSAADALAEFSAFKAALAKFLAGARTDADRLSAGDRAAVARPEDFRELRESVCPSPASHFYRTDGLGAGPAASPRRAYAGAFLACELTRGGASESAAATLVSNAAWVDRILRINQEAREPALRSALYDGGPLGDLAPARADAFALLGAWDPDQPFPGPAAPARPAAWSPGRYGAARAALTALGDEWRRSAADVASGARFGARVCAAGAGR